MKISLKFLCLACLAWIVAFSSCSKDDSISQSDISSLVQEGKIHPRIEKTFPFTGIPAAISYIEAMRTRGKVVVVQE